MLGFPEIILEILEFEFLTIKFCFSKYQLILKDPFFFSPKQFSPSNEGKKPIG